MEASSCERSQRALTPVDDSLDRVFGFANVTDKHTSEAPSLSMLLGVHINDFHLPSYNMDSHYAGPIPRISPATTQFRYSVDQIPFHALLKLSIMRPWPMHAMKKCCDKEPYVQKIRRGLVCPLNV